jgi:hypothetical protein
MVGGIYRLWLTCGPIDEVTEVKKGKTKEDSVAFHSGGMSAVDSQSERRNGLLFA